MAFANISLTGDKQVDMMLRTLEPKLQKKALRKGTREGAKKVLEVAKSRVPVESGNLLRTMKVRAAKKDPTTRSPMKRGDIGHAVTHVAPKGHVGRGTLDPFYSQFVEYGTQYFQASRYLRSSLYDNQRAVVQANQRAVRKAVAEIGGKESGVVLSIIR